MAWTLTGDADEYLAAARCFLESDPVRHTVQLTVALAVSARRRAAGHAPPREGEQPGADEPLFGWWRPAGATKVSGVMMHTPPYPVGVTDLVEGAAQSLAAELQARGRRPDAVNGERTAATSFAAAWNASTGQVARQSGSARLFRLARLTAPRPGPEGAARVASTADHGLLADWLADFHRESGTIDSEGDLDDRLSFGGLTLWERDGRPVALAGIHRPAAGVARIGPVYTPPQLRGRGYAGAATAAVSQAALDQGTGRVVLFANPANRTSTALYQRLGFVPVEDRIELRFRGAGAQG